MTLDLPVVVRVAFAVASGFSAPALGQWTAVRLHPAGSSYSSAGGVSATRQYGAWQATSMSSYKPVIWTSSTSFINLAPGSGSAFLVGGNDEIQFGVATGSGTGGGAAIWRGTPESRVLLDPS